MPAFVGFDPIETNLIQRVISDAGLCIDSALREAFEDNDRFQTRLEKYFSTSESDSHAVMKAVNSMKLLLDTNAYYVQRGGNLPDANAGAEHLGQQIINFGGSAARQVRTARLQGTTMYRRKRVNVFEAVMRDAARKGAMKMELYDEYFALPYKSLDAQSQLQVFLHELSHVAAGTLDIDEPACYEFSGVQYCKSIDKAAVNAENYGMFLQSYIT